MNDLILENGAGNAGRHIAPLRPRAASHPSNLGLDI